MTILCSRNHMRIGDYFTKKMYCGNYNKKVWVIGEYVTPDGGGTWGWGDCFVKINSTQSRKQAFFSVLANAITNNSQKLWLAIKHKFTTL